MFGDYIRQARLGISMLAPLLVPISILGAARFGWMNERLAWSLAEWGLVGLLFLTGLPVSRWLGDTLPRQCLVGLSAFAAGVLLVMLRLVAI